MPYKLEKLESESVSTYHTEHLLALKLCSIKNSIQERWVNFECNSLFYCLHQDSGPGWNSEQFLLFMDDQAITFSAGTGSLVFIFEYSISRIDTSEKILNNSDYLESQIRDCLTAYCEYREIDFISLNVTFESALYSVPEKYKNIEIARYNS